MISLGPRIPGYGRTCHQVKPALIMEEAMTKVFKLKLSAIQKDTCQVSHASYSETGGDIRNSSDSMSCVQVGQEASPRWSRTADD